MNVCKNFLFSFENKILSWNYFIFSKKILTRIIPREIIIIIIITVTSGIEISFSTKPYSAKAIYVS